MKNFLKQPTALSVSICLLALSLNDAAVAGHAVDEGSRSDECVVGAGSEARKRRVENTLSRKVQFTNTAKQTFNLSDRMLHHTVPAVSIAIIKNYQIDWSHTYGVESLSAKVKAGCGSYFQAGSIAKPVTMMAVLRMAERGELDLDADIQTYLKSYTLPPGKQTEKHPVTFRNILKHTSGITSGGYAGYSRDIEMPGDAEILMGKGNSNSKAIEVLVQPDTYLRYSGGGYTLAELALQDIHGKPFETIMDQWALDPLEMKNSDFSQPIGDAGRKSIVSGYGYDGAMIKGGWHNYPEQAAAGLWTTATDLSKFLIEMGKGYLGKSDVFSKALMEGLLTDPTDGHAYGFIMRGQGKDQMITHYGGTAGYRSASMINLSTGDGAVILTNSDTGMQLVEEILIAVSGVYDWPLFNQVEFTQKVMPESDLKRLAGDYKFEEQNWKVVVRYLEEEGQIALVFPNGDIYPLTPTEKDTYHFVYPENGVEARFTSETGKIAIQLYGQQGTKLATD